MLATPAFVITFVLALGLSLALTPLMSRLGRRFGVVTRAEGRRQNEGDRRRISKLGGGAIFLSFTIAALAAQFLAVPHSDPNEVTRLAGLLIGGAVIYLAGLIDDVIELKPLALFAAQVIAALVAIHSLIFIEYFNNPLTGQQTPPWPFFVTVLLTLGWLIGMTNTVNFLDGSDGLAGGVVFIAAVMLFVNSAFELNPPQTSVALLPLALMGAALGFLVYNFYPARIFSGGGAYFMGYTLGCLAIIGGAKMATVLMIMGLPVLDAVWQAINRTLRGRSPFHGDRGHLHLRLLDYGFTQSQIAIGYYAFCAFFGILTLSIESRFFKLASLLIMGGIVVAGFAILISRARNRLKQPDADV